MCLPKCLSFSDAMACHAMVSYIMWCVVSCDLSCDWPCTQLNCKQPCFLAGCEICWDGSKPCCLWGEGKVFRTCSVSLSVVGSRDMKQYALDLVFPDDRDRGQPPDFVLTDVCKQVYLGWISFFVGEGHIQTGNSCSLASSSKAQLNCSWHYIW